MGTQHDGRAVGLQPTSMRVRFSSSPPGAAEIGGLRRSVRCRGSPCPCSSTVEQPLGTRPMSVRLGPGALALNHQRKVCWFTAGAAGAVPVPALRASSNSKTSGLHPDNTSAILVARSITRSWPSGTASPCHGESPGFDSRRPLRDSRAKIHDALLRRGSPPAKRRPRVRLPRASPCPRSTIGRAAAFYTATGAGSNPAVGSDRQHL